MSPTTQAEICGGAARLPLVPEPTEVEIELTNACNASCAVCPRDALPKHKGMMSGDTFKRVVDNYAALRNDLAINRVVGRPAWPVLTFAGLGEPTLHPDVARFAELAVDAGLDVVLFTNGSRLDERLGTALLAAGVRAVYVSFWGITPDEYSAAMGLDFHVGLRNVETMRRLCAQSSTELVVCWVRAPQVTSTPEEVARFWSDRGVAVDMSEFTPWNRGGFVSDPALAPLFAGFEPVDTTVPIWCSQLAFTDTVTWDGKVVLCSQDYFERRHVLGTVYSDPRDVWRAKARLFADRPIPALCQSCRKPDRNYRFGSGPWDQVLDAAERARYDYDLRGASPGQVGDGHEG